MKKILVFLVMLSVCQFLFAAKPKVAVMDIFDKSNKMSKELIENATEMMRGKLSATGKFMVIDRSSQQEKMKAVIGKEKKESYNQNYDKDSQIPLGRALAADSILRSTISCLGNDCMLSAELVDIAREVSTNGGTAKFTFDKNDLSSLLSAIEDVIEQIAQLGKGELAGSGLPEPSGFAGSPSDSFRVVFDANERAEVFIDGTRVCKSTPCQQTVQGGTHTVKMTSRNMSPMEETIDFYRDEKIVFQMADTGTGVTITPVTHKGMTITGVSVLNGKTLLGTAPGSFFVSSVNNKLTLKRAGFEETTIRINPGDLNINPVMEFERYRPYKGGAIAGFVVGGVLFVSGVIAYGVGSAQEGLGYYSDADTTYIASYALMGIGIGGIVLGAVLISIKRPVPGAEGFTLNVSGNGAKVSYTYNF